MKKKAFVLVLLAVVLAAGLGGYAQQRNAACTAAAIAYLEEQKPALNGAQTIPPDVDPETGRVIRVHAYGPGIGNMVIPYLMNAAEVHRVKAVPELAYPHVFIGDRMSGNNEKLYYSEGRRIFEFTLNKTDSLVFLLHLTEYRAVYPKVREYYTEGVIRQLEKEIEFGDRDILTFRNDSFYSIDIRTRETAEMLFRCIRNCDGILDLTTALLAPEPLPIQINGKGVGAFEHIYAHYQETGQFIGIYFTPEDSEQLRSYVMSLQSFERVDLD